MKEAILFLEEATSYFKELKSRVEGFEKGSSPQLSIDGRPINVKSEHRRPHAGGCPSWWTRTRSYLFVLQIGPISAGGCPSRWMLWSQILFPGGSTRHEHL
uniref:Uncharacterized protein n=1 Tax=Nelumbo nucifera TaxID=4432 RepID=A0A822XMR8_NELNU|nr:TPA_asm: hypothetical protein HUJ06_020281 [Nelumbo nucifera]